MTTDSTSSFTVIGLVIPLHSQVLEVDFKVHLLQSVSRVHLALIKPFQLVLIFIDGHRTFGPIRIKITFPYPESGVDEICNQVTLEFMEALVHAFILQRKVYHHLID